MLDTIRNAWRVPDLRRRLLYTLLMFVVFRVGVQVPVPGIDRAVVEAAVRQGTLFGLIDLFAGGALSSFSILAMSITPYINASIVMQLLTVVIPKLEQLAKEGQEGQRIINRYTRYATVGFALLQAIGTTLALRDALIHYHTHPFISVALTALTLTTGTMFLMWLGESITEKGIGNGISIIIFAGIVGRLPQSIVAGYQGLMLGTYKWWQALLFLVLATALIILVIWMAEGQRKIQVQYAKRVVGRRVYGGQATHLPMRVNAAGVIPVIFASSVLMMPVTIAQFMDQSKPWVYWMTQVFMTHWSYLLLQALLVIFFTYFYTMITFNPIDVADNIKKNGGFIPGYRPGRPTAEYLFRISNRLALPGALFLAFITVTPTFIAGLTGIQGLYFGGTALLIVVGVALETMKQIEAQMLMRHYQGFVK